MNVNLRSLPDKTHRATIPDVPLSVLDESHIKHDFFAVPGNMVFLQSTFAMQGRELGYFQVYA